MLIDAVQFGDQASPAFGNKAISAFMAFLERKLGVTIVYDKRRIPFGRSDLIKPIKIAMELERHGIIEGYWSRKTLPDEPPIRSWSCRIKDPGMNHSGGASADDDEAALMAALAESLERYIWWTQRDYFTRPMQGTVKDVAARHNVISLERFAGFSPEQRQHASHLQLTPEASYLWIEGTSLINGKKVHVPAQQVSAAHRPWKTTPREPLIRTQITNGLATWPTKAGAQLRGILECLEREAYMILWFNQLTLPRVNLTSLRKRSYTLDKLILRCERYKLRVHIIPMPTDAPTHATCAILEDGSAIGPRFAFGLKANRSLTQSAEGAILEALRARNFTRLEDPAKHFDPAKPVEEIGHRGRTYYWWLPEHAKHLEFLIGGAEKEFTEAPWEGDTEEEHLGRIIRWCAEKKYECVSVPLGISRANPTSWHIEMVIMPEIQPTHLTENLRHLGGERLKSVPQQFGYAPRERPYTDRPHPYC